MQEPFLLRFQEPFRVRQRTANQDEPCSREDADKIVLGGTLTLTAVHGETADADPGGCPLYAIPR